MPGYRKVEVEDYEMGDILIKEHESAGTAMVNLPIETFRTTLEKYGIFASDEAIEEARSWMKKCLEEAKRRLALMEQ